MASRRAGRRDETRLLGVDPSPRQATRCRARIHWDSRGRQRRFRSWACCGRRGAPRRSSRRRLPLATSALNSACSNHLERSGDGARTRNVQLGKHGKLTDALNHSLIAAEHHVHATQYTSITSRRRCHAVRPSSRRRHAVPLCCFSNIIVLKLHLTHYRSANTHSSMRDGNRRLPARRCLIGWRRVWTVCCRTCAMRCGR